MFNEADTRAKLIDPGLHDAGWSDNLISREYPISVGRIEIIGETHRRAAPKKADYILRLTEHGEALAVVEAKDEGVPASRGMAQAKAVWHHRAIKTNGRRDSQAIIYFSVL